MSTNYFLVPTEMIEAGVNLDWVKQIHIAHVSRNGVMFQAVKGSQSFQRIFNENVDSSSFYYAEIDNFDTLETWTDIRNLVGSDDYRVIDEYGSVIDSVSFIELIENNENSRDSRYNHMIDWLNKNPLLIDPSHFETVALDPDGYSFEYREFI